MEEVQIISGITDINFSVAPHYGYNKRGMCQTDDVL